MVRKNVSMEDIYLKKLQPFLDKNNGNLSAAIRDAIELADAALEGHESVEDALDYFIKGSAKYSKTRNDLIESGEYVLISQPSFRWFSESLDGILITDELVSELFNPYQIKNISDLLKCLNKRSRNLGWGIEASLINWEEDRTEVLALEDGDPSLRAFLAVVLSIFLGRYLSLDVSFVYRKHNSILIFLQEYKSDNKVPPGIRKNFGTLDYMFKEIKSKPYFWTALVESYVLDRYERINLNKNLFEVLLSGEVPDITGFFESFAGKSMREISLSELFVIFKKAILPTQIISNIERTTEGGKIHLNIRHPFSEEKVILKLVELFSKVFRAAGYTFEVRTISNLIIFEFAGAC